jgi:hypothetical protein
LIRQTFRREWLDAVVGVVFDDNSHHRGLESPRILVTLDHHFGDDVEGRQLFPESLYMPPSNCSLYCVGRRLSAGNRLVIQHRPQPPDLQFTSDPAQENNLASIILTRAKRDTSSPFRDALLDIHDAIDEESVERGGPGRISLEELIQIGEHVDLEFLTCWLYVTF